MNKTIPKYRVTSDDMYYHPIENFDGQQWINDVLEAFLDADHEVHSNNYEFCVRRLKENLLSWVKAGAWAFQIKIKRVYKHYFRDWKEFCQVALGKSHWYINRLIEAARVVKELAECGYKILPQNESQARPLSNLKGSELIQAWDKVLRELLPHHITGKTIEATIKGEPMKQKKRLEIPLDNWDEFVTKARDAGFDPKEILNDLMGNWEPGDRTEAEDDLNDEEVEEVPQQRFDNWQQDLKALVEEKRQGDNWLAKLTFWAIVPTVIQQLAKFIDPPDDGYICP